MEVKPVIDYYLVLGVPRNASFSHISEAYERLSAIFAEEAKGQKDYTSNQLRINEAYLKLRTPQSRMYYDSELTFFERETKKARDAERSKGKGSDAPLSDEADGTVKKSARISNRPIIWKMIDEDELRSLAEEGRPYNLDKLLSISASGLFPMRTRLLAGELAIEEYRKLGFSFMLFCIATDINFPDEVRRLAGTRAVALYERCARECDKDAPGSVALAAADAADMLLCMADPFLYNRMSVPGGRDERSFVEGLVPLMDDVRESAALAATRALIHQKRILRCAWLVSHAPAWFSASSTSHILRTINEAGLDIKGAVAAFETIHDPQRYAECVSILNKRAKRDDPISVRPSERVLPEARRVFFSPRK